MPKLNDGSLYALQVRAFLNAAQDVVVDSDTVDDILCDFEDADDISDEEADKGKYADNDDNEEDDWEIDLSDLYSSTESKGGTPSCLFLRYSHDSNVSIYV
jgi:hypothetical protein